MKKTRVLALLHRSERVLSLGAGALAGVALLVAMVFVVIGVVARYVLGLAVLFVDEYVGYGLVFITFMGLAYTLRTEGHISVDVVVRRLSAKTQNWLGIATPVLTFCITVFVTIQTADRAVTSFAGDVRAVSPLETPLFVPQLFIPIGFTIFAIALVAYICRKVKSVVGETRRTGS